VVLDLEFDASTLPALRQGVLTQAAAAGVAEGRAVDVMLALHELAANAVRHGAGTGRLRMEVTADVLRCLVSDAGRRSLDGNAAASRAFGQQPDAGASAVGRWPCRPGHGLWLVRAAADQVSISHSPSGGSEVSVLFRLPGTANSAAPGRR